ncbi:MAG: multi-sensor signal transduction histidine kinase [Phycisphaerales bacterium]|nr:multi-sensor signal transduction histidine kinase [Phycisphaerales bacterium]
MSELVPLLPSAPPPAASAHPPHYYRERAVQYAFSIALVVTAHAVSSLWWKALGEASYTIFFGAVVIASLMGGYGPGLLATTLASVDIAYSFMAPYHSLVVNFEDLIFLFTFASVALLTSSLQARRRSAEDSLRRAHDELERRVRDRTAELLRSQEQLDVLVNRAADQAFFMLDQNGRVASWNSGAQRLLGYAAEAIVGQSVAVIWPTVRPKAFAQAATFDDQTWVVRADGRSLWASVVLTPVQDELSDAHGYALSLRDLSERRDLERDLLDIAEREQQRIGHDLHDGLGQELTGISMLSVALADELRGDGSPTGEHANQVADLIQEAIRHTRDLARGLVPVDLEDEGLASALGRLAERVGRLPGVVCTFETSGKPSTDAATNVHLYRVAQEAINNALRHGHAKSLSVLLHCSERKLSLSVADDGVGFSPDDAPAGMGLRLMQYRARTIRATLDIRPAASGGTIVTCELIRQPGTDNA